MVNETARPLGKEIGYALCSDTNGLRRHRKGGGGHILTTERVYRGSYDDAYGIWVSFTQRWDWTGTERDSLERCGDDLYESERVLEVGGVLHLGHEGEDGDVTTIGEHCTNKFEVNHQYTSRGPQTPH